MLKKSFFEKNKLNFTLMIVIDFLYAISNVCIAFVIQMMIDSVIRQSWNDLIRVLLIGLMVTVGIVVSLLLMKYADNKFIKKASQQYKDAILKNFLSKNHNIQEGEENVYLSALTNDYAFVEEKYIRGLSNIIVQFFLLFLSIALMLYYSVILFILVFILSIGSIYIISQYMNSLARIESGVSEANAKYLSAVKEIMSSYGTIRNYNAQDIFLHKSKKLNLNIENMKKGRRDKLQNMQSINSFITNVMMIAVFGIGGLFVLRKAMTIGVVIAFTQLLTYFINPLNLLGEMLTGFQASKALIKKCETAIQDEGDISEDDTVEFMYKENLVFHDVTFSYNDMPFIEHFSYTFEKGKCYAIIGTSGSGKSTLLKILYDELCPQSGSAMIDNISIKDIKKRSLYESLLYLPQNACIFDTSLYNNITMFEKYDKETMDELIRKVQLETLIENKGYAFECGENGENLSGGERQRIALGRAILKKPQILLADEVTSALDSLNTNLVEKSLLNIENCTKILVTHKLNQDFLAGCDEILVLHKGQLVEANNFEELMKNKGYFHDMYQAYTKRAVEEKR